MLKPRLDEQAVHVDSDLEPDLPDTLMDPGRMKQVVLNLLENAIKFSPPSSPIQVRTRASEGVVQLAVRNASAELEEEDLTRIFARFVQRDGSFARQHGGVGLGLNLAKAIMELHGGTLWAELPEPGRVEFVAELPISAQSEGRRR